LVMEDDPLPDRVAPEWKWLMLLIVMGIIGAYVEKLWLIVSFALGLFVLTKNHSIRWKRMNEQKEKGKAGLDFNRFKFSAEVAGYEVNFGVEKSAEQLEREKRAKAKEQEQPPPPPSNPEASR